jgi:ABC-type multidrug transport system ATPase subunit
MEVSGNKAYAVACWELKKSYGKVCALKSITFEVEPGEIFGIIGPDGAGKTTLFRILTTLLLPDSGTANVRGFDTVKEYRDIRKIAGYMPGRFSLYQDLTVEENLNVFASLFNATIKENYHLIKDIYSHIEPFKDRRAGNLSGGMKQKLALCCALVHKPDILFLDEPTTGIDPVSRKELWEMLKNLKKQGITILVSTPYMDEASKCDRIALIQNGEFLKIDTPSGIISGYRNRLWSINGEKMASLVNDLREINGVISCFAFGGSLHAAVDDTILSMDLLRELLKKRGHQEIEVAEIEAGIEDCFMELSEIKRDEI